MAQNRTTTTIHLSPATRLSEGSYCSLANVIEFCDGEAGAQLLDTKALKRHIRNLVDAGIAGFVLPGPCASGTGEISHRLRDEVVCAVASATAEFNRRPDQEFNIPIIVPCGPCGDGISGLDEVIAQSRWAMLYGATHCLVLPPPNLARTLMAEYFSVVASRAVIPVVLCDNDEFSLGTPSLTSDTIVEIAARCGNHSNFAGMILAAFGDTGKLWRVVRGVSANSRLGGPGRVWIATSGSVDKTCRSLSSGANAVVSEMSNLAPRTCVRVHDLFASGQHTEATGVQGDLALAEGWLEKNFGEGEGIKEAMALFHGDDEMMGGVEVEAEGDEAEVARILSLEAKLRKGGGILLYL